MEALSELTNRIAADEAWLDWVRPWLICATGAVLLGLVVEVVPNTRKLLRDWDWHLFWETLGAGIITLGIAVEFFLAFVVWHFEAKLRADNGQYIERLQDQAEKLRNDNLELEKLMLPRRLVNTSSEFINDNVRERFLSLFRPDNAPRPDFPGIIQVFIQTVPDFEAQRLALDLEIVLKTANWNRQFVTESETQIPSALLHEGLAVLVVPGSGSEYELAIRHWAELLCAELTKAGITESRGEPLHMHTRDDLGVPGTPPIPRFNPRPNITSIFIEIGMKPISVGLLKLQATGVRGR